MRLKFPALVFPLFLVACFSGDGNGDSGGNFLIRGGDAGRDALIGGNPCIRDSDCLSGICAEESCIGFLMLSSDSARNVVGARISKVYADDSDSAQALAVMATSIVSDELTEVFFRARAVDLFRFLPCVLAEKHVGVFLKSDEEPVRFYAARVLATCGNKAGRDELEKFGNHESEAIRRLAGSVQ